MVDLFQVFALAVQLLAVARDPAGGAHRDLPRGMQSARCAGADRGAGVEAAMFLLARGGLGVTVDAGERKTHAREHPHGRPHHATAGPSTNAPRQR